MLIEEFSRRHQIEDLDADSEGVYTMTFDDNVEVRCFERFEFVYFISVLDTVAEEYDFNRLKSLLNYAFMRMKHSAATPTLDTDNKMLLYARKSLRDIKLYEFEEELERYVNACEEYTHFLSRALHVRPAADHLLFKP